MNFFRKSSMILAGAAAAGLLAFACAGADDGVNGSSSEVVRTVSTTNDLLIVKVYAGGGSSNNGALGGDYVEIFNPTARPISRKLVSLQIANIANGFTSGYAIDLADPKDPDATIASGHYFLVSLKPGADLGGIHPDLEAAPVPFDDGGSAPFSLDLTGGSVALVNSEDLLDCEQPQNCTGGGTVKSVFGFGKIAGKAPLAEGKPFAALTSKTAAVRKASGCYAKGSSTDDFESTAEIKPFDPAIGVDCSKVALPDAGNDVDAGADAGADDASAPDASTTDAGTGTTDAGPKDASTSNGDGADDEDDQDDGTPAPAVTPGKKKKTNLEASAPQPIASSDKSSCSAAPGPVPTSLAGFVGLGLALAALGRRTKK